MLSKQVNAYRLALRKGNLTGQIRIMKLGETDARLRLLLDREDEAHLRYNNEYLPADDGRKD